jgi:hypothetical protein
MKGLHFAVGGVSQKVLQIAEVFRAVTDQQQTQWLVFDLWLVGGTHAEICST